MFAEVILHRRVPGRFESFTYSVPEHTKVLPGQIVEVPFRNQKLAAVVRNLHNNAPKYPTRELITENIAPIILAKWQMDFASWISDFYKTPFSKVIDFFVPEKVWPNTPKRKTKASAQTPTDPVMVSSCALPSSPFLLRPSSYALRATEDKSGYEGQVGLRRTSRASEDKRQTHHDKCYCHPEPVEGCIITQPARHESKIQNLSEKLLATPTKKFLLEKNPLPRTELYGLLSNTLKEDEQALFLLPENFHLKRYAGDFSLFHGELSEKEKAKIWHDVRNGISKKIAGSRISLFLPFKNLKFIVLDFEQSESYTEKRAPYFHALTLVEHLSEIWKIPLIVISSAPRAETWHKTATKDKDAPTAQHLLASPRLGLYKKFEWNGTLEQNTKTSIVDMGNERRKGNYSLFSDEAREKIAAALSQNKQALLFINHKGSASAVICTDCSEIIRCGVCTRPLTLHKAIAKDKNEPIRILKCHSCETSKPLPESCEKCGGYKFKSLGAGTEKIEEEIKKIFGKANIFRFDKETFSEKKLTQEDTRKNLSSADIIIATQIIDKPLNLPRLGISVIITPDAMLNIPNFRGNERLFGLLTSIRLLTHGEMIIQTFLPEQKLFKYLSENQLEKFYEDELKTRESLNLPPFD